MLQPDHTLGSGISIESVAVRLVLATIAGGLLGLDRERHEKPAGLRTHMLVSLGAATFVVLAFHVGAQLAARQGEESFDPTRVLQGVVGGIGFLGAGSIIQARGQVSGVTTAASVWMAGALGSAAGVGAYVVVAFATAFALVILTALNRLERVMHKGRGSPAKPESPEDAGESRQPKNPPNLGG